MKDLKLIGTGNKEGRSFYIFEKKQVFLSFFANFLLNCGLKDNVFLEEYQEEPPNIEDWVDEIYNFKNELYDIDLIFGSKNIILIVRADKNHQEKIKKNITEIQ